jgi:hypothetical protein
MEWILKPDKYVPTHNLCIGKRKVPVMSVFWDTCATKGNGNYKLTCRLPGMKPIIGNFETQEKAMSYADIVFDNWLRICSLTYNE